MACLRPLSVLLSLALLSARLVGAQLDEDYIQQDPLYGGFDTDACPDYALHATYPHRPLSEGPLRLPYQRPHPKCRTFTSDSIEKVIHDVTSRMKDLDLARLFENTFPSTTDTTVKWHTDGTDSTDASHTKNKKKKKQQRPHGKQYRPGADPDDYPSPSDDDDPWAGRPQSFIITGDIVASWLRDSTNQLRPYQPLAKTDRRIYNLILGALNTQAEYVIESPYCNAFQPPPPSGLRPTANGQDDVVHPAYEPGFVFECKYELDSLAHFLALGNEFAEATGKAEFLHASSGRWRTALHTVLAVLDEQSLGTFDPDTGGYRRNEYTFQRSTNTGTETLNLMGVGNPLAGGTGLVRSAFRPSDDATILGYFIPANAMMAVELRRTGKILRDTGEKEDVLLADELERRSRRIADGIWEYGVVTHKKYGDVFAYEVDGYGSHILMDDANYPSLLALPLMGFVGMDDPTYRNTRKMLLEKASNPYYLTGRGFKGIGGPHIGLQNAWPMSLLIQAQTSDNDTEIAECLESVLRVSHLGLIHESVDVNMPVSYTRSWFAWANGVFADTILDIAKRKPHLIFNTGKPYEL
ncbi:hypothetical protein CONLIGDRAFT_255633 [Coniochaeta ligniaria NRRL 30616]|uniref:Glycoside hydrolase family 125 protein n=1 Tax=Coniochaeta ligniaria NRRL 30616 TaxID=1408157 RepID=A0A1J7IYA9_9PEZI|nr:hypothetical protein CONLIGDRAFT_255633 [Coniochaeta ligniaria NRRL 30616]